MKKRIEAAIEQKEGHSARQFGFKKGHSTIQAVKMMVDNAKSSHRKCFALITVEVEKAFKSATWSLIRMELNKREITLYLINIVGSYFQGRTTRTAAANPI